MNFSKGKTRDFYLLTTDVENLFINEYMSDAPGDYVKVYLFGLLYGQHGSEMSHGLLARQLGLDEKKVALAWDYWERMGVIKKVPNGEKGILNYNVEFINLREKMYGHMMGSEPEQTGTAEKKPVQTLSNDELKDLFSFTEDLTGDLLGIVEMKEISSWVEDDGVSCEVVKTAIEHCYNQGKKNIKYVAKVVEDWHGRGFTTEEECLSFVGENREQMEKFKRVLKSLGQYRQPTEAEKKIMRTWFEEMQFSIDRVLEACDQTAGTSNPSIKYVNKILEGWFKEANDEGRDVNQRSRVSQAVLKKYYEHLRDKAEREARERREELYRALPEARNIDVRMREISSELSRNLLKGMSKGETSKLKAEMKELEIKRAVLLTDNNFRPDHAAVRYSCDICRDTGMTEEGQQCGCIETRIKEAELWQKKNPEF